MTKTIAIAAMIATACGTKTSSAPDAPPILPDAPPILPDAAAPPDAADLPDAAPPPDLACLDHAPAQTASDPLVARGKLFAIVDYQVSALKGVTVALRRASDDHELGTATTADDGSFAISIASGGAAQDAYFFVDDGAHRPTYAYPGAPLTGDENALLIVADDAELARWYADAGAGTWDASKRTVIAAATDCTPKSVAGATMTASPAPAKLVYYDPNAQRWDATLSESANGFVLLTGANVTETITANAGTQTFPAHTFAAHPGAITLAVVPPTL